MNTAKTKFGLSSAFLYQMLKAGYENKSDFSINFSNFEVSYSDDIKNDEAFLELKEKYLEA